MGYSIRQEVLNVDRYVAGKPISEVKRELGLEEVIKLASNENPLGCSPKVKEVLRNTVDDTALYPDSSSFELRNAIAKQLNVKPEQIFCGAGSDSLIRVISSTILNPGDESIMAEITFPRYDTSAKLMGAKSVKVSMKNHGLDIEKMVDSITERTKLIWFCNPNNPTGTMFKKAEIEKLLDRIPKDVLFIMDEAYVEYVTDPDFPNSLDFLDRYPNMIILRTFSKAYGLASLRCGYGIASEELVQFINRVINAFDVNLYVQRAAIAAIEDRDFINMVYETNKRGKEYFYSMFKEMGLEYIESSANFVMVNLGIDDKPIFESLLRRGLIVRPGFLLEMPGWLRVTIGTEQQNEKFIDALKILLQK
jgi:histidinol-phosphate aminotransferase